MPDDNVRMRLRPVFAGAYYENMHTGLEPWPFETNRAYWFADQWVPPLFVIFARRLHTVSWGKMANNGVATNRRMQLLRSVLCVDARRGGVARVWRPSSIV